MMPGKFAQEAFRRRFHAAIAWEDLSDEHRSMWNEVAVELLAEAQRQREASPSLADVAEPMAGIRKVLNPGEHSFASFDAIAFKRENPEFAVYAPAILVTPEVDAFIESFIRAARPAPGVSICVLTGPEKDKNVTRMTLEQIGSVPWLVR